jgi:peptidoglycan/xylan/chitin deacetylase (PgdA/CDA1 family)
VEISKVHFKSGRVWLGVASFMMILLTLSACAVETTVTISSTPVSEPSEVPETTPALSTETQTPITITETIHTDEPELAPTLTEVTTPIPFPGEIFFPLDLWEDVTPVEYIIDRCEYLRDRWDPEKSQPGTIVAPIMFHSVRKSGRVITDSTSISEEYFHAVLAHAKALGFETITTEELIAFLTSNAYIPPRSMIMILDDRRPGVTERFLPYLENNDWTLTLGWIIEDQRDYLWEWMEYLAESGRLDVQSHGYWHRYIVDETSDEIINEEIYNPIPILTKHFGYRPIAFIWPGGNFTEKSIRVAHEADYQIAFSAYAHGPLMYNWIPQTEKEITLSDPLMTLPRFWSTVAWRNLDETIAIADSARTHAEEQYSLEAEWYRQSCDGILPPSPF